MKIAVNTRLLLKDKLEGIGWFAFETLKRITQQHPEHEFIFFFDRPYDSTFIFSENITPVILRPPARHPLLFILWFEIAVTWKLLQLRPDIFLSPDGYLSLATRVKSIAVIHDLNFEHYPQDIPLMPRLHYSFFFPRFARKATRIATVSDFSKKDIVAQYAVSPEKIDVVYNGVNEAYAPLKESEVQTVRNKFSNGAPYFIFVGALHPRKNIAALFRAFDAFRKASNSDVKLLLVGKKMWWTQDINDAYESMDNKNEVIFTGRLALDDLISVMGAAFALTYVSYFEGFGIPIIEAMRCDVPVITSNCTSMPEVSDGAALLIDPFSVASIAAGMLKLYHNTQLRKELIEKGRLVGKSYSWQKTADALWSCVEKCFKEN